MSVAQHGVKGRPADLGEACDLDLGEAGPKGLRCQLGNGRGLGCSPLHGGGARLSVRGELPAKLIPVHSPTVTHLTYGARGRKVLCMETATTTYRIAGITDDVQECELCGKTDLKRTVRFDVCDPDGGAIGEMYAGTDCATRVPLNGIKKMSAKTMLADAREAERNAVWRPILAAFKAKEITKEQMIEQHNRALAAIA